MKHIALSLTAAALILLAASPIFAAAQENTDKTLSPYFFVKSDNPDTDRLPLLSTSARVSIAGVIADVTVKQVYKNEGKKPIEAIYTFPASTRAAVYAMTMKVGDRLLKAQIEKRQKAREIYEKAKEEGKTTSLLEQERPNVFTMNVANVMPGDTIEVEMKYTELLIPTDKVYEFVYPTVVGPRYSNKKADTARPQDKFVETPYTHEGEKPSYKFDISVELATGVPVQKLECTSHKVAIDMKYDNLAEIKLDPTEIKAGNKDFILKYMLCGKQIETGLLLSQSKDENFFLLMLQPPERVSSKDIVQREYVFVVDVSGSMSGFPLTISKKIMLKMLKNLGSSEKFNILLFAGTSALLSDTSLDASSQNIEAAIDFVNRQQGGGGTELLPAMKRALALSATEGYSKSIVILTDGYVDVEEETFDLIKQNLGKANVFAFGIGTSVNRYLIEGIARAGMGEPFIATVPDKAEKVAEKFRSYIASPVMTGIEIKYEDFTAYDVEPAAIPDVFADRPIIIFGKYSSTPNGKIIVSGDVAGKRLKAEIPIKIFASDDESGALKYLWARNKLTELSDFAGRNLGERNMDKITELGLKYNLLTQYTSFVAVDYLVRRQGDSLVTVKQPSPLPEGVSDLAVGGTNKTDLLAPGTGVLHSGSGYKVSGQGVPQSQAIYVNSEKAMVNKTQVGTVRTHTTPSTAGGSGSNNTSTSADNALMPQTSAKDESKSKGKKESQNIIIKQDLKLVEKDAEPEPDESVAVEKEPIPDMIQLQRNVTYPELARRVGIEGKVIVRVLIDKQGKAKKTLIEFSDSELLNQAALEAVQKTKFKPAIQKGKPVSCWLSIPIQFKLSGSSIELEILGKKRDMKLLSNGIAYSDLAEGEGTVAATGSTVYIIYKAMKSDGSLICEVKDNANPAKFMLGIGEAPQSFDIAIKGMKPKGKRLVSVPQSFRDNSRAVFPGTSSSSRIDNYIFEIELLKVE